MENFILSFVFNLYFLGNSPFINNSCRRKPSSPPDPLVPCACGVFVVGAHPERTENFFDHLRSQSIVTGGARVAKVSIIILVFRALYEYYFMKIAYSELFVCVHGN